MIKRGRNRSRSGTASGGRGCVGRRAHESVAGAEPLADVAPDAVLEPGDSVTFTSTDLLVGDPLFFHTPLSAASLRMTPVLQFAPHPAQA